MIVYSGVKTDFLDSVANDTIAEEVEHNILTKMGRKTQKNEFRAWENSLQHMFTVLSDNEIPDDAGVAIEYNIPQTAKRVDFIISGYNGGNEASAVVVELKQWESLTAVDGQDALVETFTGGANRLVVHPSYQAWTYAMLIKDYNQTVQDEDINIYPCAYLHNYRRVENDPIDEPQYNIYLEDAPAFTKGQVRELREFIKRCVKTGDKEEVLYRIDHGRIRPSKSLQNSIENMLKGNREFYMIDEQKVAYEQILKASMHSMRDGKKRTIIVQGGPGTGKSVIAVNLLAELTLQGQFAQYVSKNSAPRNVYAKKLKGKIRKTSVDNMFKGSGIYTEAENGIVETILVDEAHRLNMKSGMFHNKGENQVKEIIHAAKCSVFFIDESQRVTMDDIGSADEIRKWAKAEDSEIMELELVSQFRCNGSDGYLAWIDNTLEIRETANFDLADADYDFKVCDTPNELRDLIFAKNDENQNSRLLAGYCWKWISEGKNDTDVHDIVIGDFGMSWNLGNTQTYAIDPGSINEIGCIHTAQGLEFDYVGVIIGDDMRYEDGHIITDVSKRASTDQSIKGIKKLAKEDPTEADRRAEEIIKNTYRTLMTRGMKGCYVYCTNSELGEYLKNCSKS